MSSLQIALFGCVRVTHDNWLTVIRLTRDIQALLAYLLLQRDRIHSREVLAGIFWGEHTQEKSHGSLNTALWKLKKLLEPQGIPAGTYLISNRAHEVGFNRESQYWLDVEVFEEKTNYLLNSDWQGVGQSHTHELAKTLEFYKGELLEGFYDNWALRERERLSALRLKSLIYLLHYYGFHRMYEQALSYGQQILDVNSLREEIHREMMRYYVENGQRALALQQYEICRATLATELGIPPMEDTQALYTQIFTTANKNVSLISSKEEISLDQALRQIREASQTIDLAKEQIQQAYQLIAKHSNQSD
jgi:DNA-binding SARP family transcriptional activator